MLAFFVHEISTLVLRALGAAGLHPLGSGTLCVRGGLAFMFLFTASTRWRSCTRDIIAMVPPLFRSAESDGERPAGASFASPKPFRVRVQIGI